MAEGRIGRLIEGEFLSERGPHKIITRRICPLAFGCQAAGRWFDLAGIELIKLFDVGDDFSDLRRKGAPLLACDFEMRELRNFFDVGFCDWHNYLPVITSRSSAKN